MRQNENCWRVRFYVARSRRERGLCVGPQLRRNWATSRERGLCDGELGTYK
jgi:hypothetical protein